MLQDEYQQQCGSRPAEDVAVSPLQRFGLGGWPTSMGVIVYLSAAAGTPDQVLADLRCHRAFMMLGPAGMDDCALDLPGIAFDARGDREGITLSIVVKDPALVEELHRRAAHELEAAKHFTPRDAPARAVE